MNLDHLLKSLLALPTEAEWVEFKHNNDAPEEIGEYISALANSAALHGRNLFDSYVFEVAAELDRQRAGYVTGKAVPPRLPRLEPIVNPCYSTCSCRMSLCDGHVTGKPPEPEDPSSKSRKHAHYVPFWA